MKSPHTAMKSSLHSSPTREKPAQQLRPRTAQNKQINDFLKKLEESKALLSLHTMLTNLASQANHFPLWEAIWTRNLSKICPRVY